MAAIHVMERRRRDSSIRILASIQEEGDKPLSALMLKAMKNRKLVPNNVATAITQNHYRR